MVGEVRVMVRWGGESSQYNLERNDPREIVSFLRMLQGNEDSLKCNCLVKLLSAHSKEWFYAVCDEKENNNKDCAG